MEFCIWGCGKRGKNVYRFMRGKKVCAFIDSNPKFQGGSYKNIPIISFDTYLEQYRNCVVIVTPHVGAQEIEQLLYQHNVTYLSSEVLPQEITDDGIAGLVEIAAGKLSGGETAYLYGLNLFSVCLLDYFMERQTRAVKIVPEDGADPQLIKSLRAYYGNRIGNPREIGPSRLYITSDKYNCRELPAKNQTVLYDFLSQVPEYRNPRIEALKDIHKGKRCFIIGCGPSLRIEDLDTLAANKEICISVNGIIRAFQSTAWRPNYYLCQHAYGFNEWQDTLLRDYKIDHMLISDGCLGGEFDPAFIKFHLSCLDVWEDRPPFFSRDFSRGAYVGGNVMYTCIQFAFYLGCSEMYLYGVDHTVTANKKDNHFSKDYLADETKDPDLIPTVVARERMETNTALAHARELETELGFKVYNASRKTMLEAFERVDFDTLFTE